MTENDRLTAKQLQLISLLLSGMNHIDATKKLGIADKTGRLWMGQPLFSATYQQGLDSLHDTAMKTLQANVAAAVDTLVSIMTSEISDDTPRLRAAKIVLDHLAIQQAHAQVNKASETAGGIPSDLLEYLTNEDLGQLARDRAAMDAILDEAKARMLEATTGIASINSRRHTR